MLLSLSHPAAAADHAVVLQYHHFGDKTPPSTSVTIGQFKKHLEYLEENEYTVWPLDRIVEHLQAGTPLPERCVAITIDDAYASVFEDAFPLLRERGLPFTVFVPTEGVDRGFASSMTWEQMRAMQEFGGSFASHSSSHDYQIRRLGSESDRQWTNRITADITGSIERIREELGSHSTLYAYPYGEYDTALRTLVTGLGLIAFAQHSGPLWKGSDFAALPRFPMAGAYADMPQFVEKVSSLPLPVISADPDDPLLPPGVSLPVLRVQLSPGDYRKEAITCYTGGQGRIQTKWIDPGKLILEITANRSLAEGRSKYTCTAPHRGEGRYYWYSHLWIRNEGAP